MARFVKSSTFQECIKAGRAPCSEPHRTLYLLTAYSLFTNLEQSVKKWHANAVLIRPRPGPACFALDPRPWRVYNSAYSSIHSREKYRYVDKNGF